MPYTILIVDDSATTRAMIKRTIGLAQLGDTELLEAGNGAEGLERLAARSVDLVLADLHMPEMDGETMARRILADPALKHVPVYIVSADPNVQRKQELEKAGVRGFLKKPFTPEQLRKAVCQTLGVHHA